VLCSVGRGGGESVGVEGMVWQCRRGRGLGVAGMSFGRVGLEKASLPLSRGHASVSAPKPVFSASALEPIPALEYRRSKRMLSIRELDT
jgi:hypothetical protein